MSVLVCTCIHLCKLIHNVGTTGIQLQHIHVSIGGNYRSIQKAKENYRSTIGVKSEGRELKLTTFKILQLLINICCNATTDFTEKFVGDK